jgi:hypothetical protein
MIGFRIDVFLFVDAEVEQNKRDRLKAATASSTTKTTS